MSTYSSLLVSIKDVMVVLGSVGRAVGVQLGPAVEVKLQPSVVNNNGLVFAGVGGYSTHPMLMHNDVTIPDTRPDKPPFGTTQY